MIFYTRSGNYYQYDRQTHLIGICEALTNNNGAQDMNIDEPLPALTFSPVPHIDCLPNMSTFIIEITHQCNLRCTYCCYSGRYTHNRTHENKSLNETYLPEIFDFIDANRVKERELTISFYGGEPLFEKDLLKNAVKQIRERFEGDTEIVISTNLLRFDIEQDLPWCIASNITLNVSLDGPEDIHDKQRGNGTFIALMKQLSEIKAANPIYFAKRVNLLVTITDIDNLMEIAQFWGNNKVLHGKEPFTISGLAESFRFTRSLSEKEILNHLYILMDYYERNRDNLFLKTYSNILTSQVIERPIFELTEPSSPLCCLPYNPRCIIDVDGNVGICEKTCDELRIGNVRDGFNYSKINSITEKLAEKKIKRCSTCWMQRFCQMCFTSYFFNDKDWDADCAFQKKWMRISLIITCEMAERNLFDSEDAKQCKLRPLSIDDASAVLRIMKDEETVKYIDGFKPLKSIKDAKDFLRMFDRNPNNVDSFLMAIEYNKQGLIGIIGFDEIDKIRGKANLFFILSKEYWHRGVMTAMMSSFLAIADIQYKHIDININQDNEAANSLIDRFERIKQYKL